MIPGGQDLGDAFTPKGGGPGVLRILQQPRGERVLERAHLAAERARLESRHGIDHDRGGQLPAGNHEVADRDLVGDQVRPHPLVHALVAPTDQGDALVSGQLLSDLLGEGAALGCKQDDRHVRRQDRLQRGGWLIGRLDAGSNDAGSNDAGSKRQPGAWFNTISTARQIGSGFITMPPPPP